MKKCDFQDKKNVKNQKLCESQTTHWVNIWEAVSESTLNYLHVHIGHLIDPGAVFEMIKFKTKEFFSEFSSFHRPFVSKPGCSFASNRNIGLHLPPSLRPTHQSKTHTNTQTHIYNGREGGGGLACNHALYII